MKHNVVTIQPATAEPPKPGRNTKGEGSIFQRGDGYWYFQLVHEGQKYVKSLATKNERQAKKNAVAKKREIIGKIERQEDTPRTTDNVTVGDICELYLDWVKRNRKAWKSVEQRFNHSFKMKPLWNMKASKV